MVVLYGAVFGNYVLNCSTFGIHTVVRSGRPYARMKAINLTVSSRGGLKVAFFMRHIKIKFVSESSIAPENKFFTKVLIAESPRLLHTALYRMNANG